MKLVEGLAAHAAGAPGHAALLWPGGQLDYAALVDQVESAMVLLEQAGTHVLALDVGNGPAWVILDIAALELGICLIPLPAFFSDTQLQYLIYSSGADTVISDNPRRLRQRLPGVLCEEAAVDDIAGQRLSRIATTADVRRGQRERRLSGVSKVTFTSGTTGGPKGVMLSWTQIRAVVESLVEATAMTAGDRHLVLMPLAVLLENIAGVYVPLWAGASVLLNPLEEVGLSGSSGLDGPVMSAALNQSRATTAIFTPQTLQGVVEALESGAEIPFSMRFAAVGGAPVSPRLLQRAAGLGLPVFEGYGLSECASVVCLNTPAQHRPGSVGRPLPHLQLRVADDGEVCVLGQSFVGYLGDEPVPGDRWATGDLGELDEDGFLYLRGRRRNVFITAFGRNVAPEWVERELALEPAIAQAAVYGEARPYNVAVVVPNRDATAAEIERALARVNASLPDYARVSRWTPARAPFSPANGLLTGTGRIRREALYDFYRPAIDTLYYEARTS